MKAILKLHLPLINYGNGTEFIESKFNPIKNRPGWCKPGGGLWASPIASEYGWREWCEGEEFYLESLIEYFQVLYGGNTLVIDEYADIVDLPWMPVEGCRVLQGLDFEAMLSQGVDGILLTVAGQNATRFTIPNLYGWDCESVLVLNPAAIKPIPKAEWIPIPPPKVFAEGPSGPTESAGLGVDVELGG